MLKIPPDTNILIPVVLIFLMVWFVLRRWWFEPAMRVVAERSKRSEGALREAEELHLEAERMRREHAAALDEARTEAHREMHEIVRSAEAEQKRLVAEATDEAQRTLGEVRTRVAEDIADARRALRAEVPVIARQIAQKVLGRAV
jgi:F-type H+-transporting ATPase subunit b